MNNHGKIDHQSFRRVLNTPAKIKKKTNEKKFRKKGVRINVKKGILNGRFFLQYIQMFKEEDNTFYRVIEFKHYIVSVIIKRLDIPF